MTMDKAFYYRKAMEILEHADHETYRSLLWHIAKEMPQVVVKSNSSVNHKNVYDKMVEVVRRDGLGKIKAVVRLRKITGWDLKDSKYWIEEHFPELK